MPPKGSKARNQGAQPPVLGFGPIPTALLDPTRPCPSQGRLRWYRLLDRVAYTCSRCQRHWTSWWVTEVDGDPARRLCSPCRHGLLACDPTGQCVEFDDAGAALPSRNQWAPWVYVYEPATLPAAPYAGKWLLFVPRAKVDQAWATIVEETQAGRLGQNAKVATRMNVEHNRRARNRAVHVTCVYTVDARDHADVGQVLAGLRRLGYTERLCYKEDAATRTGLYGDGAALYVAASGELRFEQCRDLIPIPPERRPGRSR